MMAKKIAGWLIEQMEKLGWKPLAGRAHRLPTDLDHHTKALASMRPCYVVVTIWYGWLYIFWQVRR